MLIETYRGYEINFEPDKDAFYCVVEGDQWTKKSYTLIKTAIDNFIKEQPFEPFNVVLKPNEYRYSGKKTRLKIIGIRKDGRFISDNKGKKEQVSEYDENDYILDIPENEVHFATIAILGAEIDELKKKITIAEESIKTPSLKDLKTKYIK